MPDGPVSLARAAPVGWGRRNAPPIRRGRWHLLAAALGSVLLHAGVVAALLLGLHRKAGVLEPADTPAVVELVMSPPGGKTDAPATAPKPSPTPPQKADAIPPPDTTPETAAVPAPPAHAENLQHDEPAPDAGPEPPAAPPGSGAEDLPLPPPAPPAPSRNHITTAKPAAPAAPAAPRTAQTAPQFSLGGISSDTNAFVTGPMVAPPGTDPKYHNKKPDYPVEAARRGERGIVVLLIHVSPAGLVQDADIARSSGFRLLDNAAREAVLTWHFLPAVKDGRPIPFDMPMRIVFDLY